MILKIMLPLPRLHPRMADPLTVDPDMTNGHQVQPPPLTHHQARVQVRVQVLVQVQVQMQIQVQVLTQVWVQVQVLVGRG